MRELTLFFTLLVFSYVSYSQTLKTDNLDLNPGGTVYDVVYDAINDDYIVAGDFTSIQGVARQNLAIIDAATFTVSAINPITSINGAIHAVEIHQTPASFPNDGISRLYLGGAFTSVNGVTRNYLCQMRRTEPLVGPFNTNYTVNSGWDPEIVNQFNPADAVNDFGWRGDTLTAVGQFLVLSTGTNYTSNDFGGILSFNGSVGTFDYELTFSTFKVNNIFSEHYEIEFYNGEYLLAGDQGFNRFDPSGVPIASFPICSTGYPYVFNIQETDTDTLIIGKLDYGGGEGISIYELDGNMINCPFNNQIPTIFVQNGSLVNGFIETYNEHVFIAEPNEILSYARNGTAQMEPNLITTMNSNWYSYVASGFRPKKMKVAKDKLFVFGDNLTTINGQSHVGLAAMCLPPNNSETFSASDSQVCEEDIATFTIPPVEYAEGFRWEYSGTGAQYRIAGTTFPFQSLSDNYVNGTNANSIEVYFPSGTTNGTITVSPYNTCNSAIDYQFGGSQSVNVSIVGLPDISMADTLFLNCYNDSGWITVNSVTAGVSYQIQSSFGTVNNDSLLRDTTIIGLMEEYYFGTVIEPINGCISTDSTWLDTNFVIPTVPNNDIVLTPAEMNCNVDSLEVNIVTAGLSVSWEYDFDTSVPLPNPFYIYSDDSLNFTSYFTNIQNGCENSLSITVPNNQTQAVGGIAGYPSITLPLDTISCNQPTLNLTCTAIDGTATWTATGTDNITITTTDSAGMTNNTQVYSFETIHNISGCPQIFNAVIYFDLDPPFIVPFTGNPSINCSDASAEVVHITTGNPIEGWLDDFGLQTGNDTLFATSPGEYYYQAQGTNGCFITDTVQVSQTLDMTVNLISDTLICPGDSVFITANPIINTGETPTYLWSDGSTTNSGSATGGVDTALSVIVQTNSGCIGYDTTNILITAPIAAYFSSSSGCGASATIQVDSIFGGNGGYEYSLDGTNWQTTAAFNGVNTGTLDIYVRDNLGCIYTFNETVAPSNDGPPLDFLIPTYSDLGDTTVAVSFGTSAAYDSLNWVLPSNAEVVVDTDSLIAFIINTEGWYDVTLIGYLDSCQYSDTSTIYFGSKPDLDSAASNWGILEITLSPNPTTGNFTLNAELGKNQSYSIFVNGLDGQALPTMTKTGTGTVISENFSFPIGTATGTYVIHFVGQYDARQLLILKN
ncbi:MAG: hypothetical protein NXI10_13565 [bacterium]|nr:hypothetical protein [bacterium]